jgi:hypothetical protein
MDIRVATSQTEPLGSRRHPFNCERLAVTFLSFRSPRVRRFKRLIALPDVNVEVSLLNCCREMLLRRCSTGAKVGLGLGKALQKKELKAHKPLYLVVRQGF